MQLAIILEIKLQKYIFEQNIFSAAIMVFFKPCDNGNVHAYATTKLGKHS